MLDHGRSSPRAPRPSSSGSSPAATSGSSSPTRDGLDRPPPPRSATPARDDDALALNVPSDGSVASLQALLDRLDAESIAVAGLTVHTPDLDDVFLALTR